MQFQLWHFTSPFFISGAKTEPCIRCSVKYSESSSITSSNDQCWVWACDKFIHFSINPYATAMTNPETYESDHCLFKIQALSPWLELQMTSTSYSTQNRSLSSPLTSSKKYQNLSTPTIYLVVQRDCTPYKHLDFAPPPPPPESSLCQANTEVFILCFFLHFPYFYVFIYHTRFKKLFSLFSLFYCSGEIVHEGMQLRKG